MLPEANIGGSISLSEFDIMNDPDVDDSQKLHFEPLSTGLLTIMALSQNEEYRTVDIYTAYNDNDKDFFRIDVDDRKQVLFMSIVDVIYPATEDDVKEWVGDRGIIGNKTFITKDNIEWNRVLFEDTDSFVDMGTQDIDIKYAHGIDNLCIKECLYYRDTNFNNSFANKEYYLIRSVLKNNKSFCIEMYAGVYIPYSSLKL